MLTAVIIVSLVALISLITGWGAMLYMHYALKGAQHQIDTLRGRNAELGVAALALLKLLDQLGMDRIEYDQGGHLIRSCIPIVPNPAPIPDLLRGELATSVEYAMRGVEVERLEDNSEAWAVEPPGDPDKMH